jgi:hypothetical protein
MANKKTEPEPEDLDYAEILEALKANPKEVKDLTRDDIAAINSGRPVPMVRVKLMNIDRPTDMVTGGVNGVMFAYPPNVPVLATRTEVEVLRQATVIEEYEEKDTHAIRRRYHPRFIVQEVPDAEK